jgi:cold shock CspA family protein
MALQHDEKTQFYGTIKTINEASGFGFIQCEESHSIYGRDVFIHKQNTSAVFGQLMKGQQVRFTFNVDEKGHPRASKVYLVKSPPSYDSYDAYQPAQRYEVARAWAPPQPVVQFQAISAPFQPADAWPAQAGWSKRSRPEVEVSEEILPDGKRVRHAENPGISSQVPTFTGHIKTKPDSEKGFGFVECEEIKQEFNKDAFLHFSDCPWADTMDLQVGDPVLFNVDSGRNPKDIRVVRIVRLSLT